MLSFKPKEFMDVMVEIRDELRRCHAELNAMRVALESEGPPFTYTFTVPSDERWPTYPDMVETTWSGDTKVDEP